MRTIAFSSARMPKTLFCSEALRRRTCQISRALSNRKAGFLRKDGSLELLRGVAAIVVLLWHTMLAFRPAAIGIFTNRPADSLQASFAFILFNGQSAVYLFFVLSSFVLVKRYVKTRRIQDLLLGAAKRLPRLAGPVLLTVLASCALFKLDLYFFKQAGALTGSPWLAGFAYASPVLSPATASLSDAFSQGTWRTFILGDNYYDSSLWTMWFEFWGSLMVFALAPPIFFLHDRLAPLGWCVIAIGAIMAWQINFIFLAFPLGLSLHLIVASKLHMNTWVRTCMVAVALALLGYAGHSVGVYKPLVILEVGGSTDTLRQTYVAILASIMLVYAVLTTENPPAWLSGKAAKILGDLSFPLYLVHVPVICSVGSWVFLASGSAALSAAASILASIVAALPLIVFNNWWVAAVGSLFDKFRLHDPITVGPDFGKT